MFLPPASRTTMSGRAMPPSAPSHGDLLVEVAPGAHPGQLDHPAQLHLAPAAAGLGPPQGGDQRLGLQPQLGGVGRAILHLLGQRRVRQVPGPVRLAQLVLYPGQGLAQRLDQVLDRGLALVQLARGGDVGRGQAALGDLQEPAGALVQRLRGQLAEPLGELARRPAQAAPARPVPVPGPRGPARSGWPCPRPAGRGRGGSRARRRARGPAPARQTAQIASIFPCWQPGATFPA